MGPAPRMTTRSPAATRPLTIARIAIGDGLDERRQRGILVADRKDLGRGKQESLLQAPSAWIPVRPMLDAGIPCGRDCTDSTSHSRSRARRLPASRAPGAAGNPPRPRRSWPRSRAPGFAGRARRVADRSDVPREVVEVRATEPDRVRGDENLAQPRGGGASTSTTSIVPCPRVTAARICCMPGIESRVGGGCNRQPDMRCSW